MFQMNWMPELTIAAAWLIFLGTYAVVALGKIPVYRIDRAGAALLGGSLMVATGVLSLDEAYRAVDFNTVALLLGMMIVVANLRLSGFFRVITHWIARYVSRPLTLLGMVIFSSGVLSAFLVFDTICLVMTPLVLELVIRLKRNPIPYLLAVATASNIGSVATITGNPQNIILEASPVFLTAISLRRSCLSESSGSWLLSLWSRWPTAANSLPVISLTRSTFLPATMERC
jgi:Na+/H+ antiporter NhaD/arsenite permease-like protein